MNARTLHKLMIPAPFLLMLGVPSMIVSADSKWAWLAALPIVALPVYAVFGGVLGLMFVFGKLQLDCPLCGQRSRVVAGGSPWGSGPVLRCPTCGDVVTRTQFPFKLRCDKWDDLEAADEATRPAREAVAARYESVSLFATLRQRPQLIFRSYLLNAALYVYLFFIGARWQVIAFSAITSAGCLGAIFAGLKRGELWSNGSHATPKNAPGMYWRGIAFCYVIYLVFTVFALPLHFQDVRRGRIPPHPARSFPFYHP